MILGARLGRRAGFGPGPTRSLAHLAIGSLVVAAIAVTIAPESGGWGARSSAPAESPRVALDAADLAIEPAIPRTTPLDAVGDVAPAPASPADGDATPRTAAAVSAARLSPWQYTVQPGDSLAGIAQQFGLDVSTLLGSNDLDDPDLLPTGRPLTILPVRGVLYEVGEGDTLNRIAERYDLAVAEILRANGIADADLIAAGDELILPGAKPQNVRAPVQTDTARAPAADTSDGPRVAQSDPPRTELASAIVLPPASAPAPVAPAASASSSPAARPSFVWPASGPITTYFGEVGPTSPRGHAGLDIAAPWGSPVRSAAAGQVILATRAGGPYGTEVIVDHGGGLRTVYGHLSELDVASGEQVERGELLGLVGSTGYSTGPHLHFEVRQSGELRDPLRLLP